MKISIVATSMLASMFVLSPLPAAAAGNFQDAAIPPDTLAAAIDSAMSVGPKIIAARSEMSALREKRSRMAFRQWLPRVDLSTSASRSVYPGSGDAGPQASVPVGVTATASGVPLGNGQIAAIAMGQIAAPGDLKILQGGLEISLGTLRQEMGLLGNGAAQASGSTNRSYATSSALSVTYLAYAGGSDARALQAIDNEIRELDLVSTQARMEVVRLAAASYYKLLLRQAAMESSVESLPLRQFKLEVLKQRHDLGQLSREEWETSKAEYAILRLGDEAVEARYVEAWTEYCEVTGAIACGAARPIKPPALKDGSYTVQLPLEITAGARCTVAQRRSIGEASLAVAVSAAKSQYLPQIGIGASYGWSGSSNGPSGALRAMRPSGFSVGISLSWNVFDAFRGREQLLEATAAAAKVDAKNDEFRISAAVQARSERIELDDALAAVKLSELRLKIAALKTAGAEQQWQRGVISDYLKTDFHLKQMEAAADLRQRQLLLSAKQFSNQFRLDTSDQGCDDQ